MITMNCKISVSPKNLDPNNHQPDILDIIMVQNKPNSVANRSDLINRLGNLLHTNRTPKTFRPPTLTEHVILTLLFETTKHTALTLRTPPLFQIFKQMQRVVEESPSH